MELNNANISICSLFQLLVGKADMVLGGIADVLYDIFDLCAPYWLTRHSIYNTPKRVSQDLEINCMFIHTG